MTANFFGSRVPIVDPQTGLATPLFYLFLQQFFGEQDSNGDNIDLMLALAPVGESDDAVNLVGLLSDQINQSPPASQPLFYQAEDVLPVIGALQDQIAMLRREIDWLKQGGPNI